MPTLDIAGWKVSYLDSGVGLPLIFIPGLTEYKESFDYQLRGLSDRYRVISYDVRPGGGSDYTIASLADDLTRFMDSLRISSAVIAGHCFGGLIAQEFARTHPERAAALVLISSFAKAPTHSNSKLLRMMSSGHQNDPEGWWAKLLISLGMIKKRPISHDEYLAWVSMQAAKTPADSVKERLRVVRHFDSRKWLEQLWMPTLLLVGEYEQPAFLSSAQMIQRGAPESIVEVIEESGHYPHIERHDQVNLYMDEFLHRRLMSLIE